MARWFFIFVFFCSVALGSDAVSEKRLSLDGGKWCLKGKPFSGVAFVADANWRAEMTYLYGVLDGPVTVIVNNKLFSQFSYSNGVRSTR
jgi:hypothetical protein